MIRTAYRRKTTRRINTKIKGPNRVKVGFPAGKAGSDILERAVWNHFGTSSIPERPFLFLAVRKNKEKYRRYMRAAARQILRGEQSTRVHMERLGILGQGDVQKEITSLRTPANSPATIRRKGSSNPLIDTGQMRGAVTYKVEGGA